MPNERGDEMENTSFMRVEEVAQELGISKSYAYKIVQKLNDELKSKGISHDFRTSEQNSILWSAPVTVQRRKE